MSRLYVSCLAVTVAVAAVMLAVADTRAAGQDFAQSTTSRGLTPQLQPVLSGLSSPLYVTNAKDGSNRLFIVEQGGIIKVLHPGSTTPTVFLNITPIVLSGGEQGLLGLAFHPQYATNRRFFVNYTRQTDGATVIAEYKVSAGNPDVADTAEVTLLTIPQPFPNHNGGMIEFGPDHFLYIGMGDGGSGNDPGNRSQNVNELLGKILRINVDIPDGQIPYSSPASNPFFGSTAGRDEIYALGFRNPFRWSFDRGTGQDDAVDSLRQQRRDCHRDREIRLARARRSDAEYHIVLFDGFEIAALIYALGLDRTTTPKRSLFASLGKPAQTGFRVGRQHPQHAV